MTNKHEASKRTPRGVLLRVLHEIGTAVDTGGRELAEGAVGTKGLKALGVRGPREGWDTDHAKLMAAHNDAIAGEVLGAGAQKDADGQYVPAVSLNPAATLHDQVNRKVEVLDMADHVLPVVADPQGTAYSPERGGADLTDEGRPYYGVSSPRAIIGTFDQIRGFFDERKRGGYRLVLTAPGANSLGLQISPFVRLAEDEQWKIYDPQTEIVSYVVKSVASIGLGAGVGAAASAIPAGSLPLADLADFFDVVRRQVSDNLAWKDNYTRWTSGMEFLVELLPYVALGEESSKPYARKTVRTESRAGIGGKQCVSFNLNTVGNLVDEMLTSLKDRLT
ncbi:hypothetical protein [Kribbella sp. DT2]|uniref:hypothetical protein n=1 Tax=Kribbella sp. DT2 TaxID=3393427 RepID=UPI003CF59C00